MEYSPTTSSPPPPARNYDVFLSYKAEDTGHGFVADLREALTTQGMVVYRDHEEGEDGAMKPLGEKLKAVEESRCSVVVFSEKYGDLDGVKEVGKIVMCKEMMDQLVLPIFYKVDPANVRKQKGNFEKPFDDEQYEYLLEINNGICEEVQTWRDSMNHVGNLSGWHLQHSQLSKFN